MKPASTVGACLHAVLLLGALHLCGAAHAGDVAAAAPHVLKAVIRLDDGTHLQVQEFPGHSKWAGLKHYFTAATVHVQCPGHKDFQVFVGRSMPDVRAAYSRNDRAWCGWDHFMARSPETCSTPIAPFGSTYVAISKPKSWFAGSDAPAPCSLTLHQEFSMPRFLATAMGGFLFWSAPVLSESTPFRLTGGTLGFMALSSVLAVYLVYRSVPRKRSLAVAVTLMGTTAASVARYIFGTWLPSAAQVVSNPLVLGYMALSGAIGMALTYYYNDTSNQKINTMLRVALQAVGLALVAFSAPLPEAAAASVVLLLVGKLIPLVVREKGVGRAMHSVQQQIVEEFSPRQMHAVGAARVEAAAVGAAHPHVDTGRVPAFMGEPGPTTPVALATPTAPPAVSPLVLRGLILNETTGKTIGIGKATYNQLVAKGYVVDRAAGTITPPPAGTPAGGSGSGRRTGGGSSSRRRSRSTGRSKK